MTRFGSLLVGCAALACLRPHLAAAYQPADLAGTWEFNSLASGPGAPWWERARATIAAGGGFTAYSTASNGQADTLQSTMSLSSAGIVTNAAQGTFRGALDIGTTVLAGTDTWSSGSPGTTELKVGVKMAGAYGLPDLVGAWELNTIASGPGAPWWQRGRITVAGDGSFAGTLIDNAGQPDPAAGSFNISPTGVVTIPGTNTGRGVLDAGKTVLVMTSTWTGFMAGTTDLTVGVKMAATYTLADLVGTWEINSLATGPGAPWWGRTQISVAADGSFTGSRIESGGGGGPTSGTLTISPAGVMTRSGSSTARGVLDAGKTVMVWTSVWSTGSPGTTDLEVATRVGGSAADVPAEPAPGFALEPMHPNPLRGILPTVRFTIRNGASSQLEVLDVSGRRVVSLDVSSLGAGQHAVELGERGRLAPGLYWVRLRQGTNVRMRRVVVM
jgi:hypothetical protein